jgi:hypothetical protein
VDVEGSNRFPWERTSGRVLEYVRLLPELRVLLICGFSRGSRSQIGAGAVCAAQSAYINSRMRTRSRLGRQSGMSHPHELSSTKVVTRLGHASESPFLSLHGPNAMDSKKHSAMPPAERIRHWSKHRRRWSMADVNDS